MANYWKNEVILVRYFFSNLSTSKIRPAIIVSFPHTQNQQNLEDIDKVDLTLHQ